MCLPFEWHGGVCLEGFSMRLREAAMGFLLGYCNFQTVHTGKMLWGCYVSLCNIRPQHPRDWRRRTKFAVKRQSQSESALRGRGRDKKERYIEAKPDMPTGNNVFG